MNKSLAPPSIDSTIQLQKTKKTGTKSYLGSVVRRRLSATSNVDDEGRRTLER